MQYLLGLGNYAMGDDSIGLRIIEHIAEHDLDRDFEAVEVGNNGMQVLTYFTEETDRILIVDAVEFGGSPGDWMTFAPSEVESNKQVSGISTHEGDILKLIAMGEQLGQAVPPIRILAVQPADMSFKDELSEPLAARFEQYVNAALNALRPDNDWS